MDKKGIFEFLGVSVFLFSLVFSMMFLILNYSSSVSADSNPWIIDGNAVYVDDDLVSIRAEPHTLSSSDWVYINFTSKV